MLNGLQRDFFSAGFFPGGFFSGDFFRMVFFPGGFYLDTSANGLADSDLVF